HLDRRDQNQLLHFEHADEMGEQPGDPGQRDERQYPRLRPRRQAGNQRPPLPDEIADDGQHQEFMIVSCRAVPDEDGARYRAPIENDERDGENGKSSGRDGPSHEIIAKSDDATARRETSGYLSTHETGLSKIKVRQYRVAGADM